MLTLKQVNNKLATMGYAERLVKGDDYFYFAEGEASGWPMTIVFVPRLNDLTLNQWLHEHALLRRDARLHHGVAGNEEVA
jgi:hypothetical protein